jgi:hypothetical protein
MASSVPSSGGTPSGASATAPLRTVPVRPPTTRRIGVHLPPSAGWLRTRLHYHGLSIALLMLFVLTMAGQTWSGWYVYNSEQRSHDQPEVALAAYLATGHFGEATFENWESEFLQMAFYVLLTVYLYQLGSSESKRPDALELVDLDPRESPQKDKAPWPVRKGGVILLLYENSLSLAFAVLFTASFALHATTGVVHYNDERAAHGEPPVTTGRYITSSQFWFESFQNWQSEFLSLAAMVLLTIYLRQRGSPESKPVDAPIWETAD